MDAKHGKMPAAANAHGWAALLGLALICAAGCGRAGDRTEREQPPNAAAVVPSAAMPAPGGLGVYQESLSREHEVKDELLDRVRQLRKLGHFNEFVEAALSAADARSDSAALQLFKTEALLAIGSSEDAEATAERTATLALEATNPDLSGQALRLWVVARFRQQQPIQTPFSEALLAALPADNPAIEILRFWSDSLGHNIPYGVRLPENANGTEIPAAQSSSNSVSADLNAVEARANGVSMPLVFIDTGAQHTLMTVAAARAAGVKFGSSNAQLVGFAKLAARAGLLKTLELGSLTLENVPVLVGDSAPLLSAKGQLALGTELMHHVRFTLDYPRRRVFADSGTAAPSFDGNQTAWRIPLWTFPQACLVQGESASGVMARVLIDTGNRAGTFVSARWAHSGLPSSERPGTRLVFKFKQRNLKLDALAMGNQVLRGWSVVDTMPRELERLDIVDVMLGHDLLWPYQLTIDLGRRELVLQGGPAAAHDE